MSREHYLFVTGRLAEPSLRKVLSELAPLAGFDYSVQVMPITVAALITPKWAARHLEIPPVATRVMVPGYCQGDLTPVERAAGLAVERGPRDLRQLPEFFGHKSDRAGYGEYDIEILAEINLAPRLPLREIVCRAARLESDGADVIDLGCDPTEPWPGAGEAVRALCGEGCRVSIDSNNPREIEAAVKAGAELVLSVNGTNREYARNWGAEVVAVPDAPNALETLEETVAALDEAGVQYRVDPILNPISFGFAESLGRYLEVRRRWPDVEMMMGVGNLTELTDVDSAGMNVLLLGFCQEVGIRSVLTTQEINWGRTSVRECQLARQLVHYAVRHHVLPKHLETGLVMLRDPKILEYGPEGLEQLVQSITDHSYRVFAEGGRLHLISARLHLEGKDAFDLFQQLLPAARAPIDPSEAFYLGYELAKAVTALTLGKNYRQDEALDWGILTVPELTRRQRRALRMANRGSDEDCSDREQEICDG
jgi:dihydropteroate synthase